MKIHWSFFHLCSLIFFFLKSFQDSFHPENILQLDSFVWVIIICFWSPERIEEDACQCRRHTTDAGWEDPLEEEMVTHSSIFAWRVPRTEETGGLQSRGSQRIGHDLATAHTHKMYICKEVIVHVPLRLWTEVYVRFKLSVTFPFDEIFPFRQPDG